MLIQLSTLVFMGLSLIWAIFFLLPAVNAERKWWDRFGQKWKRSAELAVDAVDYWSKGMPKNSAACRRSADETIAEAERMMFDRQRIDW